jgi:hypothetical protein
MGVACAWIPLDKEKLKLTDEETVENIRENPYLQYFLGYES